MRLCSGIQEVIVHVQISLRKRVEEVSALWSGIMKTYLTDITKQAPGYLYFTTAHISESIFGKFTLKEYLHISQFKVICEFPSFSCINLTFTSCPSGHIPPYWHLVVITEVSQKLLQPLLELKHFLFYNIPYELPCVVNPRLWRERSTP